MLPNIRKHGKLSFQEIFYQNNEALMFLNLSISRENDLIICHLILESMIDPHKQALQT